MSVQTLKSKLEKSSINSYWCKVNYHSPGEGKITSSLGEPPTYEECSNLEDCFTSKVAYDVILDWGETVGLDFANSVSTGVATLEYHNGVVKVRYDTGWQEI
jgi:hypothetical protein